MTPNETNQMNKAAVWDYWQRLNHADVGDIPNIVRTAVHDDVNWNGSAPIDQLMGVDALITGFWEPLLRSLPDLKRKPDVFMGGIDAGHSAYGADDGVEWVSGCGYLTGTFVEDWLGIPATGRKTNIHFGQFYVMRDGKIAEGYVMYDILAVMRQAGFQVLPPAPGAEGGKVPGPAARDGILLLEQDALEGRKTLQLVGEMGAGLERYVRPRDGDDLSKMEQRHYWDEDMKWYGPSGIGACFSFEEFQDFHQRPWLHGFGDRNRPKGGGRVMGFVGEGRYACGGIWDTVFSDHNGLYAGIPATGTTMTIRDFDWWKRGDNDLLVENWVPIDMIDLCRQMGVDLMDRLREQIEQRRASGSIS
jgi:predicted ester cyclase